MEHTNSLREVNQVIQCVIAKLYTSVYLKKVDETIPLYNLNYMLSLNTYIVRALSIVHDNTPDDLTGVGSEEPSPNIHDSSTSSIAYLIQLNEMASELANKDKFFAARKLSSYSSRSKMTSISVDKRKIRAIEIKKENEKEIVREAPVIESVTIIDKPEFIETDEAIKKFRSRKAEEEAKMELIQRQKKYMEELRKQNNTLNGEAISKGAIIYKGKCLGTGRATDEKQLFIPSGYDVKAEEEAEEPIKKVIIKAKQLPPIKQMDVTSLIFKRTNGENSITSRTEISGISPMPGVTIIERGLNKTNRNDVSGLTKAQYNTTLHKQSRFLPSLQSLTSTVKSITNVQKSSNDTPKSFSKVISTKRLRKEISTNISFNMTELLSQEIKRAEAPPEEVTVIKEEPKNDFKLNSIDSFNTEIVHSRNWGSDLVGSTTHAILLPRLKNKNISTRNRIDHFKR